MKIRAVLLAAGQGTRMRSKLPKLLHPLAGQPMIQHSLAALASISDQVPVVVVGHGAEAVQETVGDAAEFVLQAEQLGTGHALQQAQSALQNKADLVVVCNADLPLISADSLQKLVAAQQGYDGPFSLLTVESEAPRGFGRIVRGDQGQVLAIVEEAEATPEQLALSELNVGAYCFAAEWLWPALEKLKPSAKKGEIYLTDLVEIANSDNLRVTPVLLDDPAEAIGVNTRVHLSQAEAALRRRINEAWMLAGVTILDPNTTYIDRAVQIGQDSTILPNTILQGETHIGENSTIGPNSIIRHSRIGDACKIEASVVEYATIGNHVDAGPFAHLRKGAHLDDGVHIGNFGEVKNSHLGPGVKMGHFSYIGDATIGANTNIGAGTITANYDGKNKNHTEIGENVFIGSDTMLVAPLKIGAGARTGAGAVVTKDVAPNTVVVGIPARAIRKLESPD
ncbi:MAG: UDP-N-acetylglucosamine diphosphorylase/glucosamine-1-phosphate N-acetyltransferase [Chloroflexi bacterium]|nr:UDP-N-acetylglucosamine diphosphorylase/glucosamine-1-phosphate N-acetyltransferase [Chloroflexota bacterium]